MGFKDDVEYFKKKIATALRIPEIYITSQKPIVEIPHCKPGDLFYCNQKDSEYYGYYIYIIGDYPDLEGTGYEYYMVKEGCTPVRSHGAPRHIDDSIGNLLTPVDDVAVKAKVLLLL